MGRSLRPPEMISRYRLDPEIAAVLEPLAASAAKSPPIERGDWRALRERASINLAFLATLNPPASSAVSMQPLQITVDDGTDIAARWYKRGNERPGSAVAYAHGGGMIAGNLGVYDAVVAEYVAATGVPFLSVDYRLAPEAQGPRPARDVFAAVQWLSDLASELGVEPNRIAVMGDSGGGGVAASAAIIARDLGVGLPLRSGISNAVCLVGPLTLNIAAWRCLGRLGLCGARSYRCRLHNLAVLDKSAIRVPTEG